MKKLMLLLINLLDKTDSKKYYMEFIYSNNKS